MGRDRAKRKGKAVLTSFGDIDQLTAKKDNLKLSLDKYLEVTHEKEKTRVMFVLTRNISDLSGREREMRIKAKEELPKKYNI